MSSLFEGKLYKLLVHYTITLVSTDCKAFFIFSFFFKNCWNIKCKRL